MSAVSSYLLIYSRLLSIHLRLRRPLLLFPGTTMSIILLDKLSSSLLLICPYKFNRFFLRNVDIWHTLASKHSAPYVIIGLTTVLYTLSFSLMATFLSHRTPVSCSHFIQASLTRLSMSSLLLHLNRILIRNT